MDHRGSRPVTVSWEHAYAACSPAAAGVLRAVAAVNLSEVTSSAAGAAVRLDSANTAAALAELEQAGWLAGSAVAPKARAWLTRELAPSVDSNQAAAVIRAFAEWHTAAAEESWVARHHGEILAGVRACDRPGLRRVGVELAFAVWPFADPEWWEELAAAGEAAAIAERDPELLAELLHRSAARFAAGGERLRAEEQWVRALAIVRRSAKDPALGAAILAGLGGLYREWGRLGKALDADLGLVDLRREAGDPVDIADALVTVAGTMRAADRLSSAADYLAQADAVITGAAAEPELVGRHARILASWGRALWELGEHGGARRQWSRALAMLVDVDDDAAAAVRALLATTPGDPLPNAYPNTSSSSSGGNG